MQWKGDEEATPSREGEPSAAQKKNKATRRKHDREEKDTQEENKRQNKKRHSLIRCSNLRFLPHPASASA